MSNHKSIYSNILQPSTLKNKDIMKKKKRILFAIILASVLIVAVCLIAGGNDSEAGHYSREKNSAKIAVIDRTNGHITTAVQQIMIGSKCGSYDEALSILKKLKAADYEAIELNDFMIHPTVLSVKLMTKFAGMPIGNGGKLDWPKLIEESGLKVQSLHVYLASIEEDPKGVAEEAKLFGTDTIVLTGMYRFDYSSLSEVEDLARRLNEAGKALKNEGIRLLYHNHNCELQKVDDGRTAFDVLIEETDPEYVNFEFDSYWFADGGADVEYYIEKLGPRMKLWHINDRGNREKGPYNTPLIDVDAVELGYGNMNLEKYAATAKKNGLEGVVLETHKNWIDKDPVKSAVMSFEFIKNNF